MSGASANFDDPEGDLPDPSALAASLRGFGSGLKDQVASAKQMLSDPYGTLKDMSDSIRSRVMDVGGPLGQRYAQQKPQLDQIVQQASTPEGAGELLGQNIGPGEFAKALRFAPALGGMVIGQKGMSRLAELPGATSRMRGMWVGADAQPRTEISDAASRLTNMPMSEKLGGTTLGEVLDHPELYAAYPGIEKTQVMAEKMQPNEGGRYEFWHGPEGRITLNDSLTAPQIKRILMHEVQHRVQDVENFGSSGTNPRMAGNFRNYMLDPGESEARVTQQRMNWTPEQRDAAPFADHNDLENTRLQYIDNLSRAGVVPTNSVNSAYSRAYVGKLEDPARVAARLRRGPANMVIPPETE